MNSHIQDTIKLRVKNVQEIGGIQIKFWNGITSIKEQIEYAKIIRNEQRHKTLAKEKKWKKEKIMEAVERQLENLYNNQDKMLVSTLERKKPKIILDTIMRNETIMSNLEEINRKCCEYYMKTFSKWKASFEKLILEWKAEYEPKVDINQDIYTKVTTILSKEELKRIVADLPNKKAVGPNGILYKKQRKHYSQDSDYYSV